MLVYVRACVRVHVPACVFVCICVSVCVMDSVGVAYCFSVYMYIHSSPKSLALEELT